MEVSRQHRLPVNRAMKNAKNATMEVKRTALGSISNKVAATKITAKGSIKEKQVIKPLQKQATVKFEVKQQLQVIEEPKIKSFEDIAFSSRDLPADVANIDVDDDDNPHLASRSVNQIYFYLRHLEAQFPVMENYMVIQPEITSKMRAILIDWLVQVHNKFRLLQETLYLTVSIIDRFLQVEKVRQSKLQLVGVSAMFIASKYEEMYAPEIGDFVYITDNTYDKEEILKMEVKILYKLDFSLGKPLPLHFLRRNSKAGIADMVMHTLSKYLMELLLVEYEFVKYSPSMIAAAAFCLSMKLLEDGEWNATIAYYSGYKEAEIMPLVSSICKLLLDIDKKKTQAVQRKYAGSKFLQVSLLPELSSSKVKAYANAEITKSN